MRRSLVVAVLLAGCYQTDPAPAEPTYEERVRGLIDDYYEARCRRALECGPVHDEDAWMHGSCRVSSDAIDDWVEDILDGRWTLDEEGIAECIRVFEEGSGCVTDEEWMACPDFTEPTAPEGTPCGDEVRCAPGLYCDRATSCACAPLAAAGESCADRPCVFEAYCDFSTRVCRSSEPGSPCESSFDCRENYCVDGVCSEEPPPIAPGDPCLDGLECGPDLYCDYFGTSGDPICVELGEAGDECVTSSECVEGLACRDAVCGPLGGEGESCWWHSECAPEASFCFEAPTAGFGEGYCTSDPTGGRCLPRITPDWTGPFSCPEGYECTGSYPGDFGTEWGACQPRIEDEPGEACTDTYYCPAGSRCSEGRCVPFVMPSELCGPNRACPLTHVCIDSVCEPRPDRDEPCDAERTCLVGVCSGGTCAGAPDGTPCDAWRDCEGYCSIDTLTCTPTLPEGAECHGAGDCGDGAFCWFYGALDVPTCVPDTCG